MSYSAEDLARSLGFVQPTIVRPNLVAGAYFTVIGRLPDGAKYEYRYEIAGLDNGRVRVILNGKVGSTRLINMIYLLPLVPNTLLRLPRGTNVGSPIYFAFISPSKSEFNPKPGSPLIIAYGEVRDTVPPPPKN